MSGTYSTVYIATPILIDWVATKPEALKADKPLAAERWAKAKGPSPACRSYLERGRPVVSAIARGKRLGRSGFEGNCCIAERSAARSVAVRLSQAPFVGDELWFVF